MRKLVRRSQKKSNGKTIAWVILFSFIFILILLVIFLKTDLFKWKIDSQWNLTLSWSTMSWSVNWNYVWSQVTKDWIIESNTWFWFWNFTHFLVVDSQKVFWLKSSEVDLWVLSWNVSIKWTIVDFKESLPIVEVVEAVSLEPGDDFVNDLTWDENSRIVTNFNFGNYMLRIDFWENADYSAKLDNWLIVIKKLKESSSSKSKSSAQNASWILMNELTISPFECKKWSPTLDCEMLKARFKKSWYDWFKSADWVQFYKLAEWKKWAFFNEDLFWYYINAADDSDLMNVSSYIDLISTQDIKLRVNPYVSTICKDSTSKMKTMEWIKLSIESSNLIWELTWSDTNMNKVYCKSQISLWETLETKLLDYKITGKAIVSSSSTASAVVDLNTSSAATSWANNSWNFLVYTPKNAAWQLLLPKKLAYKWAQWNDAVDFWMAGFECYQKVIAINYKSKDKLDSEPSIRVYSCITNHDDNTIKGLTEPKWLIYLRWQKSDKKFIIDAKDEDKELAKQIILY